MYHNMASLGNFFRSWYTNPIFFIFDKMSVVRWMPFRMASLTSGYLELLLIFTLGESYFLGGMYPGNRLTDLDPNDLASWVALNI